MKVYMIEVEGQSAVSVNGNESTLPGYAGTKGEAHDWVKNNVPKHTYTDTTISEVDVQADKAGVVGALNGDPILGKPLRTWGITPRGGLKEEK